MKCPSKEYCFIASNKTFFTHVLLHCLMFLRYLFTDKSKKDKKKFNKSPSNSSKGFKVHNGQFNN
jgi:hypothetical protein